MSATATPMGLRPVKLTGGRPYNGAVEANYQLASGSATTIYYGDVVKMLTTGYIDKDTATNAMKPLGVFLGCTYEDPNTKSTVFKQYWNGAGTVTNGIIRAYVCDDPDAIFAVQANASVTQAGLGANAALVQTAGSTLTGNSKVSLDASSLATTNTLPVRVVGFSENPRNAVGDAYTDVLVRWNGGAVGHQWNNPEGI